MRRSDISKSDSTCNRRPSRWIEAEDVETTTVGHPQDGETLDRRRLARAVAPEDAKDLAGSDREAHVIHCDCQPTGLLSVTRKVRRVLCGLAQANPQDSVDPHLAGANPMQVSSAGTASRRAMREESAAESVIQLLAGRWTLMVFQSLSTVATHGNSGQCVFAS